MNNQLTHLLEIKATLKSIICKFAFLLYKYDFHLDVRNVGLHALFHYSDGAVTILGKTLNKSKHFRREAFSILLSRMCVQLGTGISIRA